jgi:O-antigen/teichoic acid export membrane protein
MTQRAKPLESNTPGNLASAAPFKHLVLSNTAILGTYYVLETSLLLLLTLVLVRYLGVAEYGRLAFAISYGLMLSVLSDPGISLALTKFVARSPDAASDWISGGFYIRLLMVAGTLAIGFAPMTFSHYLRANILLLVTIAASEQVRGLTLTYCALFRGFQAMVFEAITLGVEGISLLVVTYVLLQKGYHAEAIGFVYLGARLLSLTTAAVIFRVRFGAFRFKLRSKFPWTLIREALPLGVLVLAERVNLYFVPLILVPTHGEYAAGLFQAAFKIVAFPLLLCGVVGGSLYPAMSASFQKQEQTHKLYRYGVRALWHVLIPCAVLTLLFAPQVLRIIYGKQYEPAAPLLRILTPYYLLAGLITVSYYLMPAINHQKVAMKFSLVGIGLNLAVGIPMMYRFGPQGAALTLLLTSAAIAVSYWQRVSRLGYHILHLRRDLLQWAGFVGAMATLLILKQHFFVQTWSDLLGTATLICVVYATILMMTRSLLPEEWQLLSSLRSRIWR